MLRDIFGFAEYQEKATFGLAYKLTLTKDTDDSVLNKDNATNIGKFKFISIEWYVPLFTPSIPQRAIKSKQILNKLPTELQYAERSVFMKEVNTQKLWYFEIGTEERINVPLWIFVGFQQRERQVSQNLNIDNFYRPPVTSAENILAQKNT